MRESNGRDESINQNTHSDSQLIRVGGKMGKGERLDIFLKESFPRFSRNFLQKLIYRGNVTVNKRKEKSSYLLKEGDILEVVFPSEEEPSLAPESIPLDILFEDDALMVVNKPPGMVTHPVYPGQKGTLVNALMGHTSSLSGVGGPLRPGIVHRLDKDTSGLLVVAKKDEVHLALSVQFQKREVKKKYLALVRGSPGQNEGIIDFKIGRHGHLWKKMAREGKFAREAITSYTVVKSWGKWSLLELFPLTGRTHQIRVHLKALNCFLIGDSLYGGKPGKDFPLPISRAMLHAKFLGFFHPRRGQWLEFECSPPPDMQQAIEYMERNYEVRR